MNKKAQEFSMIGIVMGIVGAIIAWIMAGSMQAGLVLRLITVAVTAFACYMIGWKVGEGGD